MSERERIGAAPLVIRPDTVPQGGSGATTETTINDDTRDYGVGRVLNTPRTWASSVDVVTSRRPA